MAFIHYLFAGIKDKVFIFPIYCIVSEMHATIFDVSIVNFFIFLSCKPAQSLIINENSDWVDPHNEYINSEVEFEVFD